MSLLTNASAIRSTAIRYADRQCTLQLFSMPPVGVTRIEAHDMQRTRGLDRLLARQQKKKSAHKLDDLTVRDMSQVLGLTCIVLCHSIAKPH